MHKKIQITVNGEPHTLEVDVRESLMEVLRNRIHMTSVKQGCGVGECGACAVIVDDLTVDSCIYLAVWADGKAIRTVEGLAEGRKLSKMQQAFVDEGAVQCGFCIPGFLMTATELSEQDKEMSRDEIKRALSGHLCRCTGYQKILEATEKGLKG